jgi:hypothetical protein
MILLGAMLYVLTALLVQRALILEAIDLARLVFKDGHPMAFGR